MTGARKAQADAAIAYMREHGSITSLEAYSKLGIMSFPKRICEIKKRGYYVKDKWEKGINQYGFPYRAKRYYLIEEA